MLRGAVEAFAAIAPARPLGGAAGRARIAAGPRRAGVAGARGDAGRRGARTTTLDPLAARGGRARPRPRAARRAREPRARSHAAGVPVTPVALRSRHDGRTRPSPPGATSAAGRSRSSSTPRASPTRPRPAGSRLGLADEAAIRAAVVDLRAAAARAGVAAARAPRGADGAGRHRAHRRRPARPGVRSGRARRAGRDPRRGARRRRRAPRAGPAGRGRADASSALRGAALLHGVRGRPGVDLDAVAELVSRLGGPPRRRSLDPRGRPQPGDRRAGLGAIAVDALVVREVATPDPGRARTVWHDTAR